MQFKVGFIDPRPAAYRLKVNTIGKLKDMDGTGRWSLHMSEAEWEWLQLNNPDTLGSPDHKIQERYLKRFIESSQSKPFRIQELN